MMQSRGLGILIVALVLSGCGDNGAVRVDPAVTLPADPLGDVKGKVIDPGGFTNMIATVGDAPGQQQTVTVSGDAMQMHGACIGAGSIVIAADGPGGHFQQGISCTGSWSPGLWFPGPQVARAAPADRYTIRVLPCGKVTKWAADVLGHGLVAADQSPTVQATPVGCPA